MLTANPPMRVTSNPLPTPRPAHKHTHGTSSSILVDSYQAGAAGTEGISVQQHFQDRAQREATVRSMFKEGVGKPDAAQGQKLVDELSVIDNDVLSLVGKSGTKLATADAGDNMQELGLIKPITSDDLQQRVPEMKKAGDRLLAEYDNYGKAIDNNQGVKEAGKRYEDALLYGFEKGVTVFQSPSQQLMANVQDLPSEMRGPMEQQLAMFPETVPLEQLAASRGAQTPEEVKEFTDLTRQLNGDRLQEMNLRGRASLQEQAQSDDPMTQMLAKRTLESDSIMVNWDSESVIVPDIYYHRAPSDDPTKRPDPAQPSLRLDYHDNRVVQEWGRGRMETLHFRSQENPNGIDNGGQYLKKTNTMVLQDGVEFAAVHEVGHRVEDIVQQRDPKFYEQWNQQRVEIYERKRESGEGSVTGYALEDRGEYFAEGFAFYYQDPELLKAKDLELYNLTEQMVIRAREMGRE